MKIEPVARRTRCRSDPGMTGTYPWSYKDDKRRFPLEPAYEEERMYTEAQMRQLGEACAKLVSTSLFCGQAVQGVRELIKEMMG